MNYIRGAFQYYRELPPINPATLTGAIDVIVVRRPDGNGSYDLASSPFHVRFGKWQILRPGDKKVTVSINGNVIPFPMKIGEAGEAFFVFETEEEITEEMATSPLTSPLQSPILKPSSSKFTLESSVNNAAYTNASLGITDSSEEEPEPLELDPSCDESRVSTSSSTLPTTSRQAANKLKDISLLSAQYAKEGYKEGLEKFVDEVRAVANGTTSNSEILSVRNLNGIPREERDSLPMVEYKEDIIIDTEGYHSKKKSRQNRADPATGILSAEDPTVEVFEEGIAFEYTKMTTTNGFSPLEPAGVEGASNSATDVQILRGQSAPPDLQIVPSSSPPDYEWDWGGFPHPSPMKGKFQQLKGETLSRASSLPPPNTENALSIDRVQSTDEVVFGVGGILRADAADPYRFLLDLDSVSKAFELSLCGGLSGKDEIGDFHRFNEHRVSWRRLMSRPKTVKEHDLIIKWDEKFVARSDQSPLFDALIHWRDNTVSSQDYTSDGEPMSSGDELSETEAAQDIRKTRQKQSTWSRWWKRGWVDREDETLRAPSLPKHEGRPSIPTFQSSPQQPGDTADTIQGEDDVPPGSDETIKQTRFAKTLRLTSEQLKSLQLKTGPNQVTFSLANSGIIACAARIFLWDSTDHIVVSDIDGTITKSDALGHVFTLIGRDWTHIGVAKLYTDICRNGYKIMYLTSRAIGQADSTRDYLKGISQNNQTLPDGPVIMSPDRLMASLHREVIVRKPEVFKMACLRDIARLFSSTSRNPFYAGFGNRITDALSYRSVNIPSTRIFTIDSSGEVKTELLERAGYKSSYTHMSDLVDQQFPPIHRKWPAEYTDFNYWRQPVEDIELPELSPPSPTLSAKSDPSGTFSRLRQLGIGRSVSRSISPLSNTAIETSESGSENKQELSLRNISSLGKLRNLVYPNEESTGQVKPAIHTNKMDDRKQYETRPDLEMPGSLPRTPLLRNVLNPLEALELDEEIDEVASQVEDEGDREIADDDDNLFDDDLLATGEMKNVPFL